MQNENLFNGNLIFFLFFHAARFTFSLNDAEMRDNIDTQPTKKKKRPTTAVSKNHMTDKNQMTSATSTLRNSPSLPTPTTSSDGIASHVRLSNIFAPLIDLNTSAASCNEQSTDYDSLTLRSLQSTMSSSSSSNPVCT